MHRRVTAVFRGDSAAPALGLGSRRRPSSRRSVALLVLTALVSLLAAGCVPAATAGSLQPTLTLQSAGSSTVAYQDGIPVPTFDPQPRAVIDLDGAWRVERTVFDTDLTLTDRRESLPRIEADAAGRQTARFDDSAWQTVDVPGSVNPPPDESAGSAWYRRGFEVPDSWAGHAVTLKFGAANYVADVWLNGRYLGYHEGGFTPFAFDVSSSVRPGSTNVIAVRVDMPEWGSRDDIVPWGLADWWDYGGLTQPVWLEATSPSLIDRADVVPHLDGADVSVTVERRNIPGIAPSSTVGDVVVEVFPTYVDPSAIAADATSTAIGRSTALPSIDLIPPGAVALGRTEFHNVAIPTSGAAVVKATFSMAHAQAWTPTHPTLYVLRATLLTRDGQVDQIYQSFGLRRIAVDPQAPRLLLNGSPVAFSGVSVHAEAMTSDPASARSAGAASAASGPAPAAEPLTTMSQAYSQLSQARRVNATLIRTAHQPGVPILLDLADRLGFAFWEEIPLYHFTPRTFQTALDRGIPQQMLREMALRDMDHPSVLFYGLANESTGDGVRTDALAQLNGIAKEIDGTRLTGQASYGFDPSDGTSDPLDVAGFTFYYGVFYGDNVFDDTRAALAAAHARYPTKPIMVLEFGRWVDGYDGAATQRSVLQLTEAAINERFDTQYDGYVGAGVWWALDDYYTMRPGITVERFGLFNPAGRIRPAGQEAAAMFIRPDRIGGEVAASGPALRPGTAPIVTPVEESGAALRLVGYLGYGLLVVVASLGGALLFTLFAGGRLRRKLT